MLLEQSFYSTVPESYAHLPHYGVWLDGIDQRPAYRYLKRLLQFLQWQKKRYGQSAERWVLKAPHHIHFPEALFETFPDVKVQKVSSFPDSCGKWQMVDSFPDTKVQFVTSFPDVKIQYVTSFPGAN